MRIFWSAPINSLPRLVPSTGWVCRIASIALLSELANVTPVFELLAFSVGRLDSLDKVVDPATLCVTLGLAIFLVLRTMFSCGVERIHQYRKKLPARVLEYEHGHDGGYLQMLVQTRCVETTVRLPALLNNTAPLLPHR